MNTPTYETIAERAHQLWQAAGRPEGRSDEFWFEAESQLKSANPDASPASDSDGIAPSPSLNPERLKAEAAAESVSDNYLTPPPTQQDAIKAAVPSTTRPTTPPHKVTPTQKRRP